MSMIINFSSCAVTWGFSGDRLSSLHKKAGQIEIERFETGVGTISTIPPTGFHIYRYYAMIYP